MEPNTLLLIFMIATALICLVGIAAMVRGGKFNRKYGVKLMGARVVFQGIALAIIAFILLTNQA